MDFPIYHMQERSRYQLCWRCWIVFLCHFWWWNWARIMVLLRFCIIMNLRSMFLIWKAFRGPLSSPNPKVHLPNGIVIANHHLYADFCHKCSCMNSEESNPFLSFFSLLSRMWMQSAYPGKSKKKNVVWSWILKRIRIPTDSKYKINIILVFIDNNGIALNDVQSERFLSELGNTMYKDREWWMDNIHWIFCNLIVLKKKMLSSFR